MIFIAAYIKFEFQKGDLSRIRDIYRRFVVSEQTPESWIKWAKFEEKQGEIVKARQVYESAIEYLGESANDESFFISFAKFEERCKEFERARTIYKYSLDHIPKHQVSDIAKDFCRWMWLTFFFFVIRRKNCTKLLFNLKNNMVTERALRTLF